jgi:CubicO group peptidase (beta-lactamase class C family)
VRACGPWVVSGLFAVAGWGAPAWGAAPPAATPAAAAGVPAALAGTVPGVMTKGGVPGLAVAVVRGGALVWTGGFGVVRAGGGAEVTADTVFAATSLGRPVFAYAVLRLAARGGIELDRSLSEYAGDDGVLDERIGRVTARRVLSETTGFPERRRGGELTIDSEPGEKFSPSAEGYLYLQKAVEAATGLPLDEFVRREVFGPLGMAASSYVWRPDFATGAVGHDYLQQPVVTRPPANADAGESLYTTASDYGRFLAQMLHPTVLDPATVARMFKREIEIEPGLAWGLGWGLETEGSRSLFWAWGDGRDAGAFAAGRRDTADGIVILTNSENGLAVAEPVVATVVSDAHPVFAWLGVDRYDSPARTIRERLVRAGAANGEQGVYRTLRELERTYPAAAFGESLLDTVGYDLLAQKRPGAAALVLERNVKLHPKSWNAYDGLAEAYAADGDVRSAIRTYRKSLALNPDNGNARAALRVLEEAKQRPRR